MPRTRKEGTSAYQFEMPEETHAAGSEKAKTYGFNLAALMRMHYEEFISRPIEDSMKMMREHNEAKQATTNGHRPTKRRPKR